jgi:hypothetical protein
MNITMEEKSPLNDPNDPNDFICARCFQIFDKNNSFKVGYVENAPLVCAHCSWVYGKTTRIAKGRSVVQIFDGREFVDEIRNKSLGCNSGDDKPMYNDNPQGPSRNPRDPHDPRDSNYDPGDDWKNNI